MRIISCHIDGFGKYENTRFDFEKGLTVFEMENGEGKTTLATFIRVMLYGMGTERKDSFGLRSTYNPFRGGKYGGWLQIEWQGKEYKLVRSFDQKSETKDTLLVLDSRNQPCDGLGKLPGETLFGLSEEGFLRTSYITWKQIDIDLGNGIGSRLGGTSADSDGIPLEKALESLEEYGKTYRSGRKKAGVYTGFIPETEARIEETQGEIYRLESLQTELLTLRNDWKRLSAEKSALNEEYEKLQEAENRRLRWENYRSLLKIADEEQSKRDELAARYPQGFPTKEEWQALRAGVDGARSARMRLEGRAFPKAKELAEKEAQFSCGVPTPEQLAQKEELVDRYTVTAMDGAVAAPTVEKKKGTGARVACWIVALVLAIVGIAFVSSQPIVGGVAFALAALSFAVSFVFGGKKGGAVAPVPAAATSQNTQLKTGLEDFFWRYNVRVSDFVAALRILRADVQTLETLRAEAQAYEAETQSLLAAEHDQITAVQSIFDRYALTAETWEEAGNAGKAYAELAVSVAEKRKKAEEYRIRYGIEGEPKLTGDPGESKYRLREAEERTREAYQRMKKAEGELEELPRLKRELTELREKLTEYVEKKKLIDVTVSSLQAADANLKDRYLLPMQESFLKYARLMGVEWAETVTLGDELEVQFEARGQLRRSEHLSDGQRALAALCIRLAIIDNVYEGEYPFCILDDPFVHLDEKHLEEVKTGLRAISQTKQVIYFTCHPSRAI